MKVCGILIKAVQSHNHRAIINPSLQSKRRVPSLAYIIYYQFITHAASFNGYFTFNTHLFLFNFCINAEALGSHGLELRLHLNSVPCSLWTTSQQGTELAGCFFFFLDMSHKNYLKAESSVLKMFIFWCSSQKKRKKVDQLIHDGGFFFKIHWNNEFLRLCRKT